MKSRIPFVIVLTAALTVTFSLATKAALLAPGTNLFPAPPSAGPIGGSILDTETEPFSSAVFTGTLTSTVITGDTANMFGGLTFTYQLSNDSDSPDSIDRLTITNYFSSVLVDAGYTPLSGTAPTFIDRASPNTLGFSWALQPLAPGTNSAILVLETSASSYAEANAFVIDGGIASVEAFAPVPETSTWVVGAMTASTLITRGVRRGLRRRG